MRRIIITVTIVLALLLAGCKGAPQDGQTIQITTPYVGGTEGLSSEFVDLRSEVFDGGRDPFDVIIKIDNKGESEVLSNRVRVKLTGINPTEFNKLEEDLIKSPEDDLIATRVDPQGNVLPSTPVFVEFLELNHFSPIAGATATFPLRADLCYLYSTNAVSKLCIREDILTPDPEGICEVNTNQPVFNSGAPVQVGEIRETAGARDKIRFSFEVRNVGGGNVFERGSDCDRNTRSSEDRVYVVVDTGMPGLSCTGLQTSGTKAEGFTKLFDGKKLVTCTQAITTRTDYEQLIEVEVLYDYEQFQQTTLTVKSSGESVEEPPADVGVDE